MNLYYHNHRQESTPNIQEGCIDEDEQRFEQARQRLRSATRAGFYVEDPDQGEPLASVQVEADFLGCPFWKALEDTCDHAGCHPIVGTASCALLRKTHGRH